MVHIPQRRSGTEDWIATLGERNTQKIAKLVVTNALIHELLDLPDDVLITSMHTNRGNPETGIYMICDRFDEMPEGSNAPTIDIEEVKNRGLWDAGENE